MWLEKTLGNRTSALAVGRIAPHNKKAAVRPTISQTVDIRIIIHSSKLNPLWWTRYVGQGGAASRKPPHRRFPLRARLFICEAHFQNIL
jgi:hypothetical protein